MNQPVKMKHRVTSQLSILALLAFVFLFAGCPGDDNNRDFNDARRSELSNRVFVFDNGSAFGINDNVTLSIGEFIGDSRNVPFMIETNPEATGTLNFDENIASRLQCTFGIATSTYEGEGEPQVRDSIRMNRCEIGPDGELRLENDRTGQSSTSRPSTILTGTIGGGN